MSNNPSLAWQKLQDVYYCIRPCYDSLNWSLENLYSNFHVRLSPTSSVIAVASKFAPFTNLIDLYLLSGTKLWSVVYNSNTQDHIVDFAFKDENLCVVLNNQKLRYYKDFKGTFVEHQYTENIISLVNYTDQNASGFSNSKITDLENDTIEQVYHVKSVQVWSHYLVLKLTDRFIITDLNTFKNYDIPFGSLLESHIHFMTSLKASDSSLTILLSYGHSVLSINADFDTCSYEITDHQLTDGPFTLITSSPNSALIALFNSTVSKIFVVNSSFDQVLLEYDTSNDSSSPYMVEWCGNDAIVLSLRDEMKLVGPGQKSISFFYDIIEEENFDFDNLLKGNSDLTFTIPIIKSEADGLKVISANKVENLSRVPDAMINLYQLGSSHPSSILLDCVDKLSQHSSKSDANISLLKSEGVLTKAMDECLDALMNEFSPFWQKKILRAVSFGKIYCDDYFDADEYLEAVNYIKILNQLRSPEIGLFLTYKQLKSLGWEKVIAMLLNRNQHYLALKIIDLLQLANLKDLVYIDWCSYKIRKELNMSDIDLFKAVAHKLLSANSSPRNLISVDEVSNTAFEEGRMNLCKLLINLEPSISKRIGFSLKYEDAELALVKCFQSGDYDLCRLLLLHLQKTLSGPQLFKLLNQNEQKDDENKSLEINDDQIKNNIVRDNLFINGDLLGTFWAKSIGTNDRKQFEAYLKLEDRKSELAHAKLKTFIELNSKIDVDDDFYDAYKAKIHKLTNYSVSKKFSQAYQVELDVLELKRRLTETYQKSFYNETSLTDILIKLIEMNQLKQASKVAKEFKVSPQKLWHLVLQTYTKLGEFTRLFKFVTDNSPSVNLKSPIGFQPFVKTGLNYKAPRDQISVYIDNCTDLLYTDRVGLYMENEDYTKAVDEALKNKDNELLQKLYKTVKALGISDVAMSIKKDLNKLGYKVN